MRAMAHLFTQNELELRLLLLEILELLPVDALRLLVRLALLLLRRQPQLQIARVGRRCAMRDSSKWRAQ
jgi:hypothetical protein